MGLAFGSEFGFEFETGNELGLCMGVWDLGYALDLALGTGSLHFVMGTGGRSWQLALWSLVLHSEGGYKAKTEPPVGAILFANGNPQRIECGRNPQSGPFYSLKVTLDGSNIRSVEGYRLRVKWPQLGVPSSVCTDLLVLGYRPKVLYLRPWFNDYSLLEN